MKTIKALRTAGLWIQRVLEVRLPVDALYGLSRLTPAPGEATTYGDPMVIRRCLELIAHRAACVTDQAGGAATRDLPKSTDRS